MKFAGSMVLFCCVFSVWGAEENLLPFLDSSTRQYGYVDQKGNVVIPAELSVQTADVFSDGLARVKIRDRYGYIDKSGQLVIPAVYPGASMFVNNRAVVAKLHPSSETKIICAVIDKDNNEIVPFKYSYISEFSEGLAAFRDGGKYGFINEDGEVVLEAVYAEVDLFKDGLAAVYDRFRSNGRYIDRSGKTALHVNYRMIRSFSEGLAAVGDGRKFGYIDKKGDLVIPLQFDDALSFSEGLAAVVQDGQYGYIDTEGRWAVAPRFYRAGQFREGRAAVTEVFGRLQEIRCGYIDKSGTPVIPLLYIHSTDFVNGVGWVRRTDRHDAYLDSDGNTIFAYQNYPE